jgi:hypothetical protein
MIYLAPEIRTMDPSLAIKYQRQANQVARAAGYGMATEIRFGQHDRVISHMDYGYRKWSTGEYVPKAYLKNFGWKNTYYQRAETVVELAITPKHAGKGEDKKKR